MMVHRDHAKQMIVIFGDGLAGPMPQHITNMEILEIATKGTLVHLGFCVTHGRDISGQNLYRSG
jgi:hypothetical protein